MSNKKLHPGAAKNLKIIGIGVGVMTLVTFGAMYLSLGGKTAGPSSSVDVKAVQQNQGMAEPRQDQISENQMQAVRQVQADEASRAAQKGQFYIPQDQLHAPVPVNPPGPTQSTETRSMQASGTDGAIANQTDPAQDAINRRRREGLERQLANLLNASPDQGGSVERVSFSVDKRASAAAQPVAAASQTSAGIAGQDATVVLAGAYQIFAGESASPIDTYKTKYASARIVAGPLAGAMLFGSAAAMDEGLSVSYTHMQFRGKAYSVDAVALDEGTATNALNADIDHRYMERWVAPILLAAVQGYHQAKAERSSTVVASTSTTTVATEPTTNEQARSAGIAKGLEIAGGEVQKEAAKPLRFTLASNVPLGVLFRKPVTTTDTVK